MAGRPSKMKDALLAGLIEDIGLGMTYTDACNEVGITETTFCNWQNEGKAAKEKHDKGETLTPRETEYLEFFEALTRAKAKNIKARFKRNVRHAMKDWKADAWWLENVGGYKRDSKVAVSGTINNQHSGSVNMVLSEADKEEMRQFNANVAAAIASLADQTPPQSGDTGEGE